MVREMTFNFALGATLASSFRGTFGSARSQIVGLARDVRTMEKSSTGQLGTRLAESRSKIKGFGTDLKATKAHLEGLRAQLAASGGASGILARQMAQAERKIESLKGNIKRSTESHKELIATIRTECGGVRQLDAAYGKLATQMEKAQARQRALSTNLAARDANRAKMSELHSGMLGTALAAGAVAAPIKMAMEFESGMADAAKTIEGMRDEAGNLTPMYHAMVQEALLLGREMPLAHSELASMMATAGQQGLTDSKEIAAYTRDAAMMAVAFGLSNQDAAEAIGGYRTSLKLSQDEVRDMLDLMNYFANTSSASEAGIADIVRRVGGLGGVAGVSHKPMTALAATLDSMKIAPEVAATGIQNLMLAMVAGTSATKRQDAVLKTLGLDAVDLSKRMQTDATGAILDFLKAVKQLPEHEQAAALKNYFGKESIKSIAPLLTQLDLLEANFQKVADQGTYAGSMLKEFSNRAATTAGAAQRAKNRAAELAITIGNALLPSVENGLNAFGAMASGLADLAGRYPQMTRAVGLAAAGTVALSVGTKALAYGYYFLKGGLLTAGGALLRFQALSILATGPARLLWGVTRGLAVGMFALARFTFMTDLATKRAVIGQKLMAGAMLFTRVAGLAAARGMKLLKIAMVGTGVGAILVGIGLAAGWVIENWDRVGPFFQRLWDWISGIFKAGWEFISSGAKKVFDYLSERFEWFRDSVAGLQKAWNFFFGDDDKAAQMDAASARSQEAMAAQTTGATTASTPSPTLAAGQQENFVVGKIEMPKEPATLAAESTDAALKKEQLILAAMSGDQSLAGQNLESQALRLTKEEAEALGYNFDELGGRTVNLGTNMEEFGTHLDGQTVNFDATRLPGFGPAPAANEITHETNITMDMKFDVKGLDEGEFRKKIAGYRGEFETIVRGVVAQMEKTQTRVKFAQ